MMAKDLATSLAMLKGVSAPRVISICLPVSTTSMSLVGLESRSTMLPASLATCVPVFMATATSACASAGASLVPSPVIATRRPSPWCARISLSFASGVASARKPSTPASGAIAAGVSGLAAGVMMVLAAAAGASLPARGERRRESLSEGLGVLGRGVRGGLADLARADVDAAHARVRREVHERATEGRQVALAQPEALLGQHHDAATLGRFIGERGELRGVGEFLFTDTGRRDEGRRLAVAERYRPGLVEQQHIDVAGGLDGASGGGDDV